MSPAELSVRRPIFISCIVILMLALGYLSLRKLPIDLFPEVTFPTVVIATTYSGSGPEEIETEVTKLIEDEVSSISGINKVTSENREGISLVIAEFNLGVDIKFAEQQTRAKMDNVRNRLPDDVDAPVIRTVSPSDLPILSMALTADMSDAELYDFADDVIKPQFEQVYQVGEVRILGGRKREIHVNLDRGRMRAYEISATQVAQALRAAGRNVPSGKTDNAHTEQSYRTIGTFPTLDSIKSTLVRAVFGGNATSVGALALIEDSLETETSRTFLDGKKAILFELFRQSGANTVRVADDVKKVIAKVNADSAGATGKPQITLVNDRSRVIRANVYDVYESIGIGIVLTVIVVYLFLGSFRSTLITGLALPNSLLGAFIFMSLFGFSINIMSLLALSLVVGLLIDDAIVVRENIYRKIEAGMSAVKAALAGTEEVMLAVVATTLAVLAVFGPIGNLEGVVGQYFKQFGLTVCFAMAVSLFDALTIAPMLSAYFAGDLHPKPPTTAFGRANKALLGAFDRFQTRLENLYHSTLTQALRRPLLTLAAGVGIFFGSLVIARFVPVTFLPAADNGEFIVNFDLKPGVSLSATNEVGAQVDEILRKIPEVETTVLTVGNNEAQANVANIFVKLVEFKRRKKNTTQVKDDARAKLTQFAPYNLRIGDADGGGGGQRPFNMNIVGADLDAVKAYSDQVLAFLKQLPSLKEPDTNFRDGKPETRVKLIPGAAETAAVTSPGVGDELRTQVEGTEVAVFRERGQEYDIRVRVRDEERDLLQNLGNVYVPNAYNKPILLTAVAKVEAAVQPTSIFRENRTRYVQLSADITPGGSGLGGAMGEITRKLSTDLKPPPGIGFTFVGQAERFKELMTNILTALGLGVLFIYLVLASLYESFITPFTIMLVIPLAAAGAFVSLFVARSSFDLFSMIGCVMLMGLATKNSILLVDYTEQMIREKKLSPFDALLDAGRTRLRPILMTSFAMIAGMLPVAIGLNEASKGRTSLGIVVVGGTVSSTFLTLYIIPAAFIYVDRFQKWFYRIFNRYVRGHDRHQDVDAELNSR